MSAVASQPIAPPATATTILIVEDTPFWQKQIEAAMQAAGYATVLAGNGMEALKLLATHKPSLIVSDIEMPQMTGLELMKLLRSRPQWQKMPIILLTTGSAKECIVEATRLRAAEYMLKGAFSAEQLVERVKKWLNPPKAIATPAKSAKPAASAFPRLLQNQEVITGIALQAGSGKTLANVAPQVIELCKTPNSCSPGLVEIIKHDPVFAMRLMQQANSAKRVGTVDEAVRSVTVETINTIAGSLSAFPPSSRSALAMWQHSIAVAGVMHKIVPRSFEMGIGVAYLIGLLHDIPEIMLKQAFPSECEAAIDFAGQAGRPWRHIMPEVFGISISDITTELMNYLKLPPLIGVPLREYAAATEVLGQDACRSAPIVDRLAMAIRFAEYYVNALQLTALPSDAFIAPLAMSECHAAYVATDAINGAEIRAHAIEAAAKLVGPDGPTASAVPASKPKIWYTRHNSFAPLDPVEEALKQVADVVSHAEPPSKREQILHLNGIVVTAPTLEAFGSTWCLPDRLQQDASHRPRVLHILPCAKTASAKSALGEDLPVMGYPFPLEVLLGWLKGF